MTDDNTVLAQARPLADSTIPPHTLLLYTYEVERLLAHGGMGEVYLARHVELGTRHAIKVIKPDLLVATGPGLDVLELFRREAAILRGIHNDAVVSYDGFFRDEKKNCYLVMEYVDGPSLAQVFKQRALSTNEVYLLRDRLISGLAAVHENGVVHRDISPDNVILPEGRVAKAKLMDFGIAKLSDLTAKTIIGDSFAGKLHYVAPEQLGLFDGQVGPCSDIYSLGLVLAAAATGKPLDMGNSYAAALRARQTVPDLSEVPAGLRPQLTAMLQPNPADRPQHVVELVTQSTKNPAAFFSDTGKRATAGQIRELNKVEPKGLATKRRIAFWPIVPGSVVAVVLIALFLSNQGREQQPLSVPASSSQVSPVPPVPEESGPLPPPEPAVIKPTVTEESGPLPPPEPAVIKPTVTEESGLLPPPEPAVIKPTVTEESGPLPPPESAGAKPIVTEESGPLPPPESAGAKPIVTEEGGPLPPPESAGAKPIVTEESGPLPLPEPAGTKPMAVSPEPPAPVITTKPVKPKSAPAPVKPPQAKPAPAKPAPVKPPPAKPAPVKPPQAKPAPAKPAPVKPALAQTNRPQRDGESKPARCRAVLLRAQLEESLSAEDKTFLQRECR